MVDALDGTVTEALRAWRVQHSAGVSLPITLMNCATICRPAEAQRSFMEASRRAEKGDSIAELLLALGSVFSPAECRALTAGWNGGRAEAAMDALVSNREVWAAARRQVKTKLMLPVAVLVMASFIAPLPGLISGNLSMTGYAFSAFMPLVVGYIVWKVCFGVMSRRGGAVDAPPSMWDRAKLSLPLVAMVERWRCLAEFSTYVSMLIKSGVPILATLQEVAPCLGNGVYRRAVLELLATVKRGEPMSTGMLDRQLWPVEFVAVVRTGEESGALDDSLDRAAGAFRQNYVIAVSALAEWLPRVLYGIVALFIIWNIIQMVGGIAGMYGSLMK